jgi:hypothetical protein
MAGILRSGLKSRYMFGKETVLQLCTIRCNITMQIGNASASSFKLFIRGLNEKQQFDLNVLYFI